MRWVVLLIAAAFLAMAQPAFSATHNSRGAHSAKKKVVLAPAPNYSAFFVAGLEFTMPPKWLAVPAENGSRAGQWKILPPHGSTSEAGEVVALFFGPGKGGNAKPSIAAWTGMMSDAEGHPASAETKVHQASGDKISQVEVFGIYSQPVAFAGMPPVMKSNYGLIGTVVENPQGNIYWKFTGPEPLIAANLPLFNQMIDSMKPETK